MDAPLTPGLQTYPATPGHRYRLAGLVRGGLTDDQAAQALLSLGFSQLAFSGKGQPPPPGSPWPSESIPPPSSDEYVFHAEGTWGAGSSFPSAVTTPNGALIFYQVWDHMPDLQQASNTSTIAVATDTTRRNLFLAGAALAAGAAGLFAGLAYWRRRQNPIPGNADGYYTSHLKRGGRLNAWPVKLINKGDFYYVEGLSGRFKGKKFSIIPSEFSTYVPIGATVVRQGLQENPVEYHSTSRIQGIPVHVHLSDGRYCVDTRAVDKYTPGRGEVTCHKNKDAALQHARKVIEDALRTKKTYPSPWDES